MRGPRRRSGCWSDPNGGEACTGHAGLDLAMPRGLKISLGQHSDKGRKETNQDFHGALIPEEPALSLKGIAIALADGISSSKVGVIAATNSWLHAQTRRSLYDFDRDKGYVCTLSVVVLKSRTAHIFHIGDARIYRLAGHALEQLTEDHRIAASSQETYLGRALGLSPQVEIDYQALKLEQGDVLLLLTDGVYEHLNARVIAQAISDDADDLDRAARQIVDGALRQGSPDNLTVQIVRIDELPDGDAGELLAEQADRPLPPLLEPRMLFDGYRIVRQVHASSRSHLYLAVDSDGDAPVVVKIPSVDLRGDADYLKRLMMEEWVGRRIDSAHVLRPWLGSRKRNYLYIVTEYVDGQTLAQW